ncbi:MAG: zinc ribbon domain-containing protein [Candidatus Omnitrophica bacterium]|nr:zinc ribbon domain-containing protein [Candidatus Omnitrophota bacterium]
MPTYEYKCETCGYRFEQFQSMSDEPLKECPQCGKPVRRVISAGAGIIMKGSKSFYLSDERKNNLSSGRTCCGNTERCDRPPCSDDGICKR